MLTNYQKTLLQMSVLVLIVYGAYLAAQWPLAGDHLFGYIGFNSQSVDAGESVIPPKYISNEFGYDGQFYYRLALAPFSNDERIQGIRFDHPAWRQQRILLPVLTWLIARGNPDLSAIVMLAINLLAITGIAIVGGALLNSRGLPPWPALLLAFYPGFAISVERFLSEPLSCLLLLLSLLSLVHKRAALGGVFLAVAVLARETALAAALAMAGIWLIQSIKRIKIDNIKPNHTINSNHTKTGHIMTDHWQAPGSAYWLPAIIVYICWQVWLLNNWSASALSTAGQADLIVWPLTGILTSLWRLLVSFSLDNTFFLFMMLATFGWVVTVALTFRDSQGAYRWIWLAYLVLATLLGTAIWDNSPGFLRTTTELNVLGMLVYLLAVRSPHRLVLVAWLGCWLLSAGAESYRLHLINQARAAPETSISMQFSMPEIMQHYLYSHHT